MAAKKKIALEERAVLTPKFCQDVIVRNTPDPQAFRDDPDPDKDLSELGVIDDDQAGQHRSNIQADLHKNQFAIKQMDIATGPGVTVHQCAVSVLGHAH